MPLIIGETSGGVLIPILVDANGVMSVSAAVSSLPSLPAGDNNIGNVDVVTLPSLPAGNNNIGNVDVVTLPSLAAGDNNIGNVDVVSLPSLPAGTNDIGDVGALNHGLVGGSFQKDPIRFGYSGTCYRAWWDLSLAADVDYVDDTAVPAGEIWVLSTYVIRYVGTPPDVVYLMIRHVGGDYIIHQQDDPADNQYYDLHGTWILEYLDHLRLLVVGCTATDELWGYAFGYRVDIDQ